MTCSDCIHIEPCYRHPIEELTNEANGIYEPDAEKWCKWFEDKSKIVELPCKVGDKVYRITSNSIREETVLRIRVDCTKNEITLIISTEYLSYASECINEIIFFTKEEAEARLKELQNNK